MSSDEGHKGFQRVYRAPYDLTKREWRVRWFFLHFSVRITKKNDTICNCIHLSIIFFVWIDKWKSYHHHSVSEIRDTQYSHLTYWLLFTVTISITFGLNSDYYDQSYPAGIFWLWRQPCYGTMIRSYSPFWVHLTCSSNER